VGTPNYITLRGLDRVTREIHWLQKVERPKITAEVSYAASLGDRSENAEYIYSKKRLREIDRRMRYLIGRLDNVVQVDVAGQAAKAGGRIIFGATVLIEDEAGDVRTWRIFGEDEVDVERGILSWKSPIARALLGRSEGDEVTYRAPGGERTVTVVEVRYDPQERLPEDLEAWRLP
jgi:transcription elongation factor GreB